MAQMIGEWGRCDSSRGVLSERFEAFDAALDECLVDAVDAERWPEGDLAEGVLVLGDAVEHIVRAVLQLTVESRRRGLHTDKGLSLHDWVVMACPDLSSRIVRDIVAVARAWDIAGHAALRAALTPRTDLEGDAVPGGVDSGVDEAFGSDGSEDGPVEIGVQRGALLARSLARVRPASTPEAYESHVETLTRYAATASDRDLKVATDHLVSMALTDEQIEAAAQRAFACRGVRESSLDGDLVRRFIITTDQEGAASIKAIMASPLCAPAPDAEGADLRTATQRHHDGLFAVLRRGVSSPGAAPTTSKAKVFVTMPLSALIAAVRHHPGADDSSRGQSVASILHFGRMSEQREPEINHEGSAGLFARPGAGHTFTGQTLTPGQVRRMACEADIIPVVLGTHSEVVDMGRESRLATPGQLKKLWLRDHECTYPGCSVPNTWCDAHHVRWWSRNGRTDIDNLALLCGRHHTIVHERDLTATFDNHTIGLTRPGDHSPTWHI